MPSSFLNIRLKCWEYSKPRLSDTCATVRPAARPFFAICMMKRRMWLPDWFTVIVDK